MDEFWVCQHCRSLNRAGSGKCYSCRKKYGSRPKDGSPVVASAGAPAPPPARSTTGSRPAPVQATYFSRPVALATAAAAVLLALLGIYSVIAFSATLRTQELAIRLALGSQRSSVMRLVLVSGAKLGLLGCAIGAVGAVFTTRLLRSMLFQVDPLDPVVIVLATISIFLLALAASLVPARRAPDYPRR